MFKLLKLKKKMYNKKMEAISSSQSKPMDKAHIFYDDVNSFLGEARKQYTNYSFTINPPKIENSQIKLTYHPETKNGGINGIVDEGLNIHLCALGYEGTYIEKIETQDFNVRRRVVAVDETGKKQTALQAQLSIAHKKNLQLQTQNTSLRRQKEALQTNNKNLEGEISEANTTNSELGLHIDQTKSQNETLKSLNTINSDKIKEIQGKVNEVLQKLKQELRRKCPDNYKGSGFSQD